MSNRFSEILFEAYNGYADKRFKTIEFGRPFWINQIPVDNLNTNIHVVISVAVHPDNNLVIVFYGNIPTNPDVKLALERLGTLDAYSEGRIVVSFQLTETSGDEIRELARSFLSVYRGNLGKLPKSWRFATAEISTDLRHFASLIDDYDV